MNEITKLFENAGIKVPTARLKILKDDNGEIYTQPPFSAEKQIELIKWLSKRQINSYPLIHGWINEGFEEKLASCINNLWQDLTEEEKQQIKEILE